MKAKRKERKKEREAVQQQIWALTKEINELTATLRQKDKKTLAENFDWGIVAYATYDETPLGEANPEGAPKEKEKVETVKSTAPDESE